VAHPGPSPRACANRPPLPFECQTKRQIALPVIAKSLLHRSFDGSLELCELPDVELPAPPCSPTTGPLMFLGEQCSRAGVAAKKPISHLTIPLIRRIVARRPCVGPLGPPPSLSFGPHLPISHRPPLPALKTLPPPFPKSRFNSPRSAWQIAGKQQWPFFPPSPPFILATVSTRFYSFLAPIFAASAVPRLLPRRPR